MLYLEYCFIWLRDLDTKKTGAEVVGKLCNVLLERNGEDKTQEELQDMVNRLVDTGRKYGMEVNIEKSQVMRVSRSNESLQIQ